MKTIHQTIEEVKKDQDFACSLELPAINCYLIYRGGNKVEYYAFLNHAINKGPGWKYQPYPTLLFYGDDFKPSPLYAIDHIEAITSLLSFLVSQPGDTDKDYFKDYTTAQLQWANSIECEHLKGVLSDYEQGFEQNYFINAFRYG